MLPAKIGEGVFGSSSGGVNPTGAAASSFAGAGAGAASVFSSAAALIIVLFDVPAENFAVFGVAREKEDDFHDLEMGSPGEKRDAWVAMAMEDLVLQQMERSEGER